MLLNLNNCQVGDNKKQSKIELSSFVQKKLNRYENF